MAAVLEEKVATPADPCHRPQPAAPRRPALQGRHRPPHLVPDAQRRTRQVQQHRHHPGHRTARQDPAGGQQGPLLVPAQVRHRQPDRSRLPRRDARHPRQAAGLVDLAAVHDPVRPGTLAQRHAGRLGLLDHRQRRCPDRAHPGPRHQGRRRPLHPRARPRDRPGWSARRPRRSLAGMLESVVGDEEGTGTKARIPGYRVAGKTGTANRVDPVRGGYQGYTASFAGFAPADNPQITVYCAIQNPTEGQLLRRPDLRSHLQAGHGVRAEDPPDRTDRQRVRPPAGLLPARRVNSG